LSTVGGLALTGPFSSQATIRPWRLEKVVQTLSELGIRGMTVSEVRGMGMQGGGGERSGGNEHGANDLVAKTRVEITVIRHQLDMVVNTIIQAAHTGEIGDGKIFILPVQDMVRIRTGEVGLPAERMSGGMQDTMDGLENSVLNANGMEVYVMEESMDLRASLDLDSFAGRK